MANLDFLRANQDSDDRYLGVYSAAEIALIKVATAVNKNTGASAN